MQNARLHVYLPLHLGPNVDGARGGAARCEGCPGLGQVAQLKQDPGLYEVELHQQGLVIQALDLPEETSDGGQGQGQLALVQES